MRFTPVIVAGLMAVAKAQDTTSAADAAAPTGLDSETQDCIEQCDADDVNCIAHCAPVPSPDEGNIEGLNNCVGDCDQGSGSASDTEAYSQCVQQCIVENYFEQGVGTPGQGQGGSGSGSGSDSGDDSSDGGDSSDSGDDSSSGDGDDSSSGDGDSGSDGGDDSSSGDGDDSGSGDGGDSEDEESGDDDSAASGLFASPLLALFGVAAAVLAF